MDDTTRAEDDHDVPDEPAEDDTDERAEPPAGDELSLEEAGYGHGV